MECTLGHLGENLGHGIRPFFGFHLRVSQDIKAIVSELIAKEVVGEVDLSKDIGKVEDLTEEESDGIKSVCSTMKTPVLDNVINLSFLAISRDDWLLKLMSVK